MLRHPRSTVPSAPGHAPRAGSEKRAGARIGRAAAVGAPVLGLAALVTGMTLPHSGAPDPRPVDARTASFGGTPLDGVVDRTKGTQIPERQPLADAVRAHRVSRGLHRMALGVEPKVVGHRWATAPLRLRIVPTSGSRAAGTLPERSRVAVTQDHQHGYTAVLWDKRLRWVSTSYLSRTKPAPVTPPAPPSPSPATGSSATSGGSHASSGSASPSSSAVATGGCGATDSVESGLTSGAVGVYQAVCHAFPSVGSYLGYDDHGEHASGKAIDVMISSSSQGREIADYLQTHASELGIYDIIYAQHIWTPARASEGWRPMPDRGSTTANHYDHVHVSVN